MKFLSHFLLFSLMVTAVGCGKDNESGKTRGVCLQYGMNGQCAQYSSYSFGYSGNVDLNGVLGQIPCEGQMNYGYGYNQYQMGRVQISGTAMTASVTTPGQSYVGITSMGDIAVIQGNGTNQAPVTFFLCQNGYAQQGGNGGMIQAMVGEYPACGNMKVITAGSFAGRNFRSPQFGRGTTGQPFAFCTGTGTGYYGY